MQPQKGLLYFLSVLHIILQLKAIGINKKGG